MFEAAGIRPAASTDFQNWQTLVEASTFYLRIVSIWASRGRYHAAAVSRIYAQGTENLVRSTSEHISRLNMEPWMPRPRERVCLQDGLKLDLNRLARQGFVRRGANIGSSWN